MAEWQGDGVARVSEAAQFEAAVESRLHAKPGDGAVGSSPGVVRVPAWNGFAWLRAGFSTRQGGRSSIYGAG